MGKGGIKLSVPPVPTVRYVRSRRTNQVRTLVSWDRRRLMQPGSGATATHQDGSTSAVPLIGVFLSLLLLLVAVFYWFYRRQSRPAKIGVRRRARDPAHTVPEILLH